MCLSLSERRKLRRIGTAVRRSDPRLASLIGIFGRLAADGAMPAHERLRSRYGRIRGGVLAAMTAIAGMIAWLAGTAGRLGARMRPSCLAAGSRHLWLALRRARRRDRRCAVAG